MLHRLKSTRQLSSSLDFVSKTYVTNFRPGLKVFLLDFGGGYSCPCSCDKSRTGVKKKHFSLEIGLMSVNRDSNFIYFLI